MYSLGSSNEILRQPRIDEAELFVDARFHEAQNAAASGEDVFRSLRTNLIEKIASDANLSAAWEIRRAKGGRAAGPDQVRFTDVPDRSRWAIIRDLKKQLLAYLPSKPQRTPGSAKVSKRSPRYITGPVRTVCVPKMSGRGDRTLSIGNITDRVVESAIQQVLEPLWDTLFVPTSFGGRRKLGPQRAILSLLRLIRDKRPPHVILGDVKNAFDVVPRASLLDIIRSRLEDPTILELVGAVLDSKTGRGIRQGSPLSMFLLNLYCDHFLDRPWVRSHPDALLLRYVDDVLVLCPAERDPATVLADLRKRACDVGLPLKESPESEVCNLATGEAFAWLGFEFRTTADQTEVRLPQADDARWKRCLRHKLYQAHKFPNSSLLARRSVLGFLRYIGPALAMEKPDPLFHAITEILRQYDFDDAVSRKEFRHVYFETRDRWLARCQAEGLVTSGSGPQSLG